MAAFAHAGSASTPSRSIHGQQQSRYDAQHHTERLATTRSPSQPENARPHVPQRGSCNFRDLTVGHQCGCTTFWVDSRQKSGDQTNAGARNHGQEEENTWCICGHHACFHHVLEARSQKVKGQLGKQARLVEENGSIFLQFEEREDREDRRTYNTSSESQLSNRLQAKSGSGTHSQRTGKAPQNSKEKQVQEDIFANPSRGSANPSLQPSDVSTNTGQPRIPATCLLPADDDEWRLREQTATDFDAMPLGLGLSLANRHGLDSREASIPSTIQFPGPRDADADSLRLSTPASELNLRRTSPSRAFMNHIMQARRVQPSIEVPTMPLEHINPEDVIQSATEVNTPSNANNTPDLRPFEQTVQEVKIVAESLAKRLGEDAQQHYTHGNHLLLGDSSANIDVPSHSLGSVDNFLSKLGIHLSSLQSHLESYPSVSASLKTLAGRIDNLENLSFSHFQAQDVVDQFEQLDVRLLELESWKADHDKLHEADDNSSRLSANVSFNSTHSLSSNGDGNTGRHSAAREEIAGIKERLEDLESAMPSASHPWIVEVVLLPWGRDLRGLWFLPDDASALQDATQDTEEWTQARCIISSRPSLHNPNSSYSGWSNQDISGWADSTEDWLSPKACGPKNAAYKRLRSRGFVRNMKLTSSNAGDIQAAIARTFVSLSEHPNLPFGDFPDDAGDDEVVVARPGLKAAFIPLRKVYQSPRLRFLSAQETVTSALWTAQFLASGVMMRASGDLKRLYVTHRDAYLQQSSNDNPWTWHQIRELPRIADSDSQNNLRTTEGSVKEGDAKEACWAFHPSLDQVAPSVEASFASMSFSSGQMPQSEFSAPSPEPTKEHGATPPPQMQSSGRSYRRYISPISDFPVHHQKDAVSRHPSVGAVANRPIASRPTLQGSTSFSKRRIASFETTSVPMEFPSSKAKRRRVSHSPVAALPTSSRIFDPTIRPSREPPSPFISEQHRQVSSSSLAPSEDVLSTRDVTTSNIATSAIQNIAVSAKRGRTPTAYATPHSGTVVMRLDDESEVMDVEGDTEVDSDSVSWNGVEADEDVQVGPHGYGRIVTSQDRRYADGDDDINEGFDEEEDEEGSSFAEESEGMDFESD